MCGPSVGCRLPTCTPMQAGGGDVGLARRRRQQEAVQHVVLQRQAQLRLRAEAPAQQRGTPGGVMLRRLQPATTCAQD